MSSEDPQGSVSARLRPYTFPTINVERARLPRLYCKWSTWPVDPLKPPLGRRLAMVIARGILEAQDEGEWHAWEKEHVRTFSVQDNQMAVPAI